MFPEILNKFLCDIRKDDYNILAADIFQIILAKYLTTYALFYLSDAMYGCPFKLSGNVDFCPIIFANL